MSAAVRVLALVLALTSVTGCNFDEPTPDSSCTKAGRAQARQLAAALRQMPSNAYAANDCDSYGDVSVQIDPFSRHATIGSVETVFARHYDCEEPEHSRNPLGDDVSTFDCTVDGMRANVTLIGEGARVSAVVTPD